jgi:hypothetical protein
MLLCAYGFCIEDNPHDTVALQLMKSTPKQQQQLEQNQKQKQQQQQVCQRLLTFSSYQMWLAANTAAVFVANETMNNQKQGDCNISGDTSCDEHSSKGDNQGRGNQGDKKEKEGKAAQNIGVFYVKAGGISGIPKVS